MKNFLILLFIYFLQFTQKIDSTKYYFSSENGDDDINDGLTTTTPWKTLQKINYNRDNFANFDSFFFKRGELFIGHISQISKNNLLFTDYGDVFQYPPIIDGSDTPTTPYCGLEIWTDNIWVENLIFNNTYGQGICIHYANNVTIKHVKIYNTDYGNALLTSQSHFLYIENVTIINAANSGIAIIGSVENKISNVVVKNCFISKIRSNDAITIHEGGTSTETGGSNFLLIGNYAEFSNENGYDITTGENITLIDNISFKNSQPGIVIGHSATNVKILRHTSIHESGVNTAVRNVEVRECLFYGASYHQFVFDENSQNTKVKNNIFYIEPNSSNPIDVSGSNTENIEFTNNLISGSHIMRNKIRFLNAQRPPDYENFVFDYNIYSSITDNDKRIFYDAETQELVTFEEFQSNYNQEINGFKQKSLYYASSTNRKFRTMFQSPVFY